MSDTPQYKSWPFQEATALQKRLNGKLPTKGYVLLQTGYGPSGLPHIGTFAEVLRTTMVQKAFAELTGMPTKLITFSDDLDGLRKVPTNVPNQELLAGALGLPLTKVPDPFGTHPSFGEHNNAELQKFLDRFGFEYDFRSATACYHSGLFDETLLKILKNHEKICNIIRPTLGEERRATYSPFLPVCPDSGKVLMAKVVETNIDAGTITYEHPDTNARIETKVTGGACKVQWKADWAMRWVALDVDYEMHGKDLTPSFQLSSKICRVLGSTPPQNLIYEMFLGSDGAKISKSKGNGLSLEEWLHYAPEESLAYYIFQAPKKQKRLSFEVIPKAVDEYLQHLNTFDGSNKDSPLWHLHHGAAPHQPLPLNFSLLLNLAAACNPDSKDVLWGFISRYAPTATPENMPFLDHLAGYAVTYYQDVVAKTKQYRAPTEQERGAMLALRERLLAVPVDVAGDAEALQTEVFTIGKEHGFGENLRAWFQALYEVLLGRSQGPRFGSFAALYGVEETADLIAGKVMS